MKKLIHVLDKDKRKRKRIELFSNLPVKIEALGRSISAKIKDVSYAGIGIILPPNQEFPTMESLETKVELPNQLFQGKIANRIILPNQEIKIGLALPSEVNKEIDFNTTDSAWDRVTDPETIQNIYNDLAMKGFEAPIEIKQNFSVATIYPIKITESENMLCEIGAYHQGTFEKGKLKCIFDLFSTCHAFDSNIERIDATKIEIKLANSLARLLRRETVRIQNNKSDLKIKIRLSNKELDTVIEEFDVHDYSEHGVSMLDPDGELSLPRSLKFENAIIEIEGIGHILGTAEVRSYQWNRNLDSYIVGLKFKPLQDPHVTNWHNFILKSRYPSLDFFYQQDDHKKIWNLFDVSGYFEFKEEGAFTDMIDLTNQSWKKLSDAGTQFAKKAMIRMDDKVVGHIQMDRIYDKTWCLHHLALDPSIRITVARDLLSLTPDVLLSEGGEYVINFTDSENTWNKKSYYNFIKDYKEKHHNALRDFTTYDVDTQKDEISLQRDDSIEIKIANKYDLKRILNDLNQRYTETEVEACGYNSDPNLSLISSHIEKYGLKRERQYLVAHKNGDFLGYSILESGSEGINIIGVINLCYINIVHEVSDELYNQVYESLMYEALKYYRERNIRYILYQLEHPKRDFQDRGLRFMCKTSRWIAVKAVFSRFSAYTNLLYGHLAARREMLRNKLSERKQ